MTDLVTVSVADASAHIHLEWATGRTFSLPAEVVHLLLSTGGKRIKDAIVLPSKLPFIRPEWVESLRLRAGFTEKRPISSRLPFSYQFVPAFLRSVLAAMIGRKKRTQQDQWARFPSWPLDLSADFLADRSVKALNEIYIFNSVIRK